MMNTTVEKPGLYGLKNSNRNFADPDCWGKNQFNNTFPAALCCYMRDAKHAANYISVTAGKPQISEIPFDLVFGTSLPNDKLKFLFEVPFDPYRSLVHEAMEKIDLVITEEATGRYLTPLEIKLTTLPDNGTSSLSESEYGSEIVVRSATMRYVALGIASRLNAEQCESIKKLFLPVCGNIRDWSSVYEMRPKREAIFAALDSFLLEYEVIQKPLVIQPVWKTKGKSPVLADNCLDVFVWSDFALARLMHTSCLDMGNEISRPQRAALRLVRFLYEFVTQGRVFQIPIYDAMLFGNQGDKEFAYRGAQTHQFMTCDRLTKPIVKRDEIKKIVLGGGHRFLSPERRFDAILFFSKDIFDDDEKV